MRSGRGKCPQCKEVIVVDLDAPEIRCPLCGALLKKSNKTVEEVRAEEQARIAAAEARERALRGEPDETPVQPEPAAEAPVEPEVEVPAQPEVEVPAEPEVEVPAEETAPEAPAEEAPAAENVDEIGMTDEELAALDDVLPTDEETAAEAPVDEIGISDEELAAMDETVPAENESEAPEESADVDIPVEDAPVEVEIPAQDEEPSDDFSVGSSVEADIPEEDAEEHVDEIDMADDGIPVQEDALTEDAPVEEAPAEEDAPVEEIPVEDIPVEEAPAEEIPADGMAAPAYHADEAEPETEEEAAEDAAEPEVEVAEEETEELAAEETVEEPAEEAEEVDLPEESEDAEPETEEAEETVAPEEEAIEDVAAEEAAEAEEPVEEPAVEEPEAPAEEAAYTDEDMAFAASLSDGIDAGDKDKGAKKVGYVAPVVAPANTPAKDRGEKSERSKKDAPKGEKKMNGSAIYKKPIAIIMAVLAFIGAAISLLFINGDLFGLINAELGTKVAEIATKVTDLLPGGISLIPVIFGGVIVLISILGLTGNNGKLGFLFTLLAGIVFTASNLFGGTAPMVKIEAVENILKNFADYINYAIYGLLLLGAVFFAISIGSSKEELEYSGFTVLLPVIYLVIAFVGYAAIVILPKVLTSFTLSEDIIKYAILGVVGLSVLLTLIGVHSNTASRGANAWLLFAAVMIVVLLNVALIALEKFVPADKPLDLHKDVVEAIVPVIAFFPLMGYAISDLRN